MHINEIPHGPEGNPNEFDIDFRNGEYIHADSFEGRSVVAWTTNNISSTALRLAHSEDFKPSTPIEITFVATDSAPDTFSSVLAELPQIIHRYGHTLRTIRSSTPESSFLLRATTTFASTEPYGEAALIDSNMGARDVALIDLTATERVRDYIRTSLGALALVDA